MTKPDLTFPEACALARVWPDRYEVHVGDFSLEPNANGTEWKFRQEWTFIDKRVRWCRAVLIG